MSEAEEFLDGDIDRSEFDKYLSGGYGVNHVTNISCSFYGAGGSSAGQTEGGATSTALYETSNKELSTASGLHHATNDYMVMKSEAAMQYESIPVAGSSLSSALADVRSSVYYDC